MIYRHTVYAMHNIFIYILYDCMFYGVIRSDVNAYKSSESFTKQIMQLNKTDKSCMLIFILSDKKRYVL